MPGSNRPYHSSIDHWKFYTKESEMATLHYMTELPTAGESEIIRDQHVMRLFMQSRAPGPVFPVANRVGFLFIAK